MGNLGGAEIIMIVLVILIFFGPKKIPEIAQGIGKGMREFKKAMKDVEDELKINDTASKDTKRIEPKDPEIHTQSKSDINASAEHTSLPGTADNSEKV